jgi:hypothetical protein
MRRHAVVARPHNVTIPWPLVTIIDRGRGTVETDLGRLHGDDLESGARVHDRNVGSGPARRGEAHVPLAARRTGVEATAFLGSHEPSGEAGGTIAPRRTNAARCGVGPSPLQLALTGEEA